MQEEFLPEVVVILPDCNKEIEIMAVVLISNHADRVAVIIDNGNLQAGIQDANASKNFSLKNGIETVKATDIFVKDIDSCRDQRITPKMIKPIKKANFDLAVRKCIHRRYRNSNYTFLMKNARAKEKPVSFLAFLKDCLEVIDNSRVYHLPNMNLAS